MNALWRLAAGQPQLLVAHAASYAALLQDDGAHSMQLVLRRVLGLAVVFACFTVAAALAGVAVLLWSTLPVGALPLGWVLWAVPLVPAGVGLMALWALNRQGPLPLWVAFRQQWAADAALLRRWSGT